MHHHHGGVAGEYPWWIHEGGAVELVQKQHTVTNVPANHSWRILSYCWYYKHPDTCHSFKELHSLIHPRDQPHTIQLQWTNLWTDENAQEYSITPATGETGTGKLPQIRSAWAYNVRLYLKIKARKVWESAECLPIMGEALGSIPTIKRKTEKLYN